MLLENINNKNLKLLSKQIENEYITADEGHFDVAPHVKIISKYVNEEMQTRGLQNDR